MNNWTWGYLVATGAVFGYWQRNIAAGIFMFMVLLLLTRLLYMVVNGIGRVNTVLHERLEDPTGGCTGYKDCNCWWHTEQRALATKKAT
jgi:hypothetical protein